MSTARLLGRTTASSGAAEEITVGAGLSLSAGALTATGGAPAIGDVTGLGTGVATAAAINVGSAGALMVLNGAGGTPSSLTGTNITGTASGLTAGTVTTNANLSGDVTSSGNTTTLATVNSNVGSFTNSSITVNAKGLITAASSGAAGATLGGNTFTGAQIFTPSTANGTAVLTVDSSTSTSFVRINDNGTVVIDADVSTGSTPLSIKYNGSTIASIGFSGTWSAVGLNAASGLFVADNTGASIVSNTLRLKFGASSNATLGYAAAGSIDISDGANGKALGIKMLTELTTIAAAATTTTTIQKPANSIILGVSVRNTVALPITSTYTVGDSTSVDRFSTAAVSKAVNTTNSGTKAGAYYNATAEGIIITPDTTPSDTTGRVRVTIHYIDVTPPTS